MLGGHEDDLVRDDARREREERRVVKEDGAQPAAGHAHLALARAAVVGVEPRAALREREGDLEAVVHLVRVAHDAAARRHLERELERLARTHLDRAAAPLDHRRVVGLRAARRRAAHRERVARRRRQHGAEPHTRQQLAVLPALDLVAHREAGALRRRRRLDEDDHVVEVEREPEVAAAAALDDDGELHNCARAWENCAGVRGGSAACESVAACAAPAASVGRKTTSGAISQRASFAGPHLCRGLPRRRPCVRRLRSGH